MLLQKIKIDMKNLCLTIALLSVFFTDIKAQLYEDYFGDGHNLGVVVSSSDTTSTDSAENTLNGTGRIPDLAEASRFLSQATLGIHIRRY